MKKFLFLSLLLFLTACTNPDAKDAQTVANYYSTSGQAVNQAKALNQTIKAQVKIENQSINATSVRAVEGLKISKTLKYYKVVKVVDGDTIDVELDGKAERVRLIGINTPETVDPRKPVECFGLEASNQTKEWLGNQQVSLEADPTQTDRDKYGRLLRYVTTEQGLFYNLQIIKLGYAYEYTYVKPYKYQAEFRAAEQSAKDQQLGLWANDACNQKNQTLAKVPELNTASSSCPIKGNINSKKEKIYHLPGCPAYSKTQIDQSRGERWFCSEAEAVRAGWRLAGDCK